MTGIKDSGSNYSFFEKDTKAHVSKSVFDESYINSFTAKMGQLLPYYTQMTGMNEDWKKSVEALAIVVNPPVVPIISRQRMFFHEYWVSFTQLWKNAQIFFDKGHSENQYQTASEIRIPKIKLSTWKRGSLADMLGFNFVRADADGYYICSALKFMAYLRIWRDMYCNKKIWCKYLEAAINGDYKIKNPLYDATDPTSNQYLTTSQVTKIYNFMFPLDDADFRIDSPQWNDLKDDDEIIQYLFGEVKYRDFVDDYFTSATLEPIFGEIPTINGTILGDTLFEKVAGINETSNLDAFNGLLGYGSLTEDGVTKKQLGFFGVGYNTEGTINNNATLNVAVIGNGTKNTQKSSFYPLGQTSQPTTTGTINGQMENEKYNDFIEAFNNTMRLKVSQIATTFTIDQIRNAESATIILEKLCKTDGSYKQWAEIFFGENPKSAYDFRPTYIGGAYQSIVYNEVVNTAGTDNNFQGQITGNGTSAGKGFIGHHHSDDFGYIIGILSIMPDTYYSQGLQREDTYESAEEFYMPDRAQLGKQAILNKELYNDPQSAENDGVFAWQNRFDEMRYRANEVHGLVADESNLSFKPYIQSRIFGSCPTLSPEFLTTEGNIDKDWLSADEDIVPPFIVQIANEAYATRPMPYRAEPATFGM